MQLAFLIARFFPFWAVPLALIFLELAYYFKRKKGRYFMALCLGAAGVLLGLSIAWGIARGDLHSDRWVRFFLNITH